MIDNVRTITPSNVANIPAMLRYWAKLIESGEEPAPRTAYLVLVDDGDAVPSLCQFGKPLNRLEEIGTFATLLSLVGQADKVLADD